MRKDAFTVSGGPVPLKSRDDVSLWCADSSGRICVLILPASAYRTVDGMTTAYSEKHQVAATLGCVDIDGEFPLLLPAAIPMDVMDEFSSVASLVKQRVQPCNAGVGVTRLFQAIRFIESEEGKPVSVNLKRVGKDLNKGELFMRLGDGSRVEVYHLGMPDVKTKPYSWTEMTKWKLSKGVGGLLFG